MAVSTFWEKQVTCPLCSAKFETRNIRQGTYEVLKRDSDFCVWYKGANPLLYSIYVCPSCGYAATSDDFEKLDRRAAARFQTTFQAKRPMDDFCSLRSPSLAIKAHLLAIDTYKLREANMALLAGLYLRIAWLQRQEGDEQAENQYMTLARDTYKVAYENARNLPARLGDVGVAYLIGEISRRLGENNTAVRWFNVAISNKNIKQRPDIEKLARAQWQAAREGYVEKFQAQSQGVYFSVLNLTADESKEVVSLLKRPKESNSSQIKSLEAKIAVLTLTKFAIATNGVECAFDAAINSLGIESGAEIILPSLAPYFVASTLIRRGIKPVIVDVSDDLTIDVSKIGGSVSSSSKAVIAVNYAGHISKTAEIAAICRSSNIPLIELALESIGGKNFDGSHIGKYSAITCFDLGLGHMQTISGGAVTTRSEELASKIRILINLGIGKLDDNFYRETGDAATQIGIDGTMNQISANIALYQATKIDGSINKCKGYAQMYSEAFGKVAGMKAINATSAYTCYPALFDLKNKKTEEIITGLGNKKVFAKRISMPLHLSSVFNSSDFKCPNAERLFESAILLPLNASMAQTDVEKTVAAVKETLQS
jgi:hypothetical protein